MRGFGGVARMSQSEAQRSQRRSVRQSQSEAAGRGSPARGPAGHALDEVPRAAPGSAPGAKRAPQDPLQHPVVRQRVDLLNREISRLRTEVEAARALNELNRKTARDKTREVQRAQARLHQRGAEVEDAERKHQRLASERDAVAEERERARAEVKRVEGELRKANRLSSSLRSKVLVAEETAKMQGSEETNLRYLTVFLEEQVREKDKELGQIRSILGTLRDAHSARTGELEARVRDLEHALSVREELLERHGVRPEELADADELQPGDRPREGRGKGTQERWEAKLELAREVYLHGGPPVQGPPRSPGKGSRAHSPGRPPRSPAARGEGPRRGRELGPRDGGGAGAGDAPAP